MALFFFAAVAVTPPPFAHVCIGKGLASPSGEPLFARLAGLPLPGWLNAFGTDEMAVLWPDFHQRVQLPADTTMLMVRREPLAAIYLARGGRCIGDVVAEPLELPSVNDAMWVLKRGGFTRRTRFLATRAGDFALDAEVYEHTAAGYLERYIFCNAVAPEGGVPGPRRYLALAAYIPLSLRGTLDALAPELEAGVATFFKSYAGKRPTS
jgi:hypothetical protein